MWACKALSLLPSGEVDDYNGMECANIECADQHCDGSVFVDERIDTIIGSPGSVACQYADVDQSFRTRMHLILGGGALLSVAIFAIYYHFTPCSMDSRPKFDTRFRPVTNKDVYRVMKRTGVDHQLTMQLSDELVNLWNNAKSAEELDTIVDMIDTERAAQEAVIFHNRTSVVATRDLCNGFAVYINPSETSMDKIKYDDKMSRQICTEALRTGREMIGGDISIYDAAKRLRMIIPAAAKELVLTEEAATELQKIYQSDADEFVKASTLFTAMCSWFYPEVNDHNRNRLIRSLDSGYIPWHRLDFPDTTGDYLFARPFVSRKLSDMSVIDKSTNIGKALLMIPELDDRFVIVENVFGDKPGLTTWVTPDTFSKVADGNGQLWKVKTRDTFIKFLKEKANDEFYDTLLGAKPKPEWINSAAKNVSQEASAYVALQEFVQLFEKEHQKAPKKKSPDTKKK